jgi:hypothetical protein
MIANLIVYNAVDGKTQSSSVEFSGNPNDVIQLLINGKRWEFNSLGELQGTTDISRNYTIPTKGTCAQPAQQFNCIPTDFKSED